MRYIFVTACMWNTGSVPRELALSAVNPAA